MDPKNPNYKQDIQAVFATAPFIQDVGIQFQDCGVGWCQSSLEIEAKHFQHGGFFHAGVLATIADHTAGGAAYSVAAAGVRVLTVEFKINLLRSGIGERITCRAQVLKPGRILTIVESEVFGRQGPTEKLLCKAMVTLANISS